MLYKNSNINKIKNMYTVYDSLKLYVHVVEHSGFNHCSAVLI